MRVWYHWGMFPVEPVGVVRSPAVERKSMPPLGVPAAIEIYPQFRDGLLRLERHSHIWVLGWFDQPRDQLQVVPRGVPKDLPDSLYGVFAVRSPMRPNPIGLSVARIERVVGSLIEVDRLDFLDGTPVLDLKPYFVNRDLVFTAENLQIGRPGDHAAMRESLLLQAERFHGERCGGLALGVRMVEHFRATRLDLRDAGEWRVGAPLRHGCVVDALIGLTRTTPGRGLTFHDADVVDLAVRGDPFLRYEFSAIPGYDDVLAAPDERLFRMVTPSR